MLLGIDIGGTSVKLGLVTEAGEIVRRQEASVSFDGYETPILTSVRRAALAFAKGERIEGVGVCAAGQIDDREGVVIGTNGKISHYEGTRIGRAMEDCFGAPASVLNDANAAVLGESWLGAARGCRDVVLATLGTGVGGGVLCGGRLLRGRRGIAGEIGHFTLDSGGPLCACGRRGCFENYASTTALVAMAREATGEAALDGRAVFARAQAGDAAIAAVLDSWLDRVAEGIGSLVHIFNPEIALIGGGVSAQEALLLRPLRERVLRGVMPRFAEGLRIERAALGNDAGLIGAVRFLMDNRMR